MVCALGLNALAGPARSLGAAEREVGIPQPSSAVRAGVSEPRVPVTLEPYQGRPVTRIVFRVIAQGGNDPSVEGAAVQAESGGGVPPGELDVGTENIARNQLRMVEGQPFDALLVMSDMSRLDRIGLFKRLEARVAAVEGGGVELYYDVTPQPLVRAVQTVGNKLLSDQQLLAELSVKTEEGLLSANRVRLGELLVGTPVDTTLLDRSARRMEKLYQEKGYYNARVSVDTGELGETGIVLFRVREGEKTRVTGLRFVGNNSFTERELRSVMSTKVESLFQSGIVDPQVLADDQAGIVAYYKDRGYLDARSAYVVTPSPDATEAIVEFAVEEGPLYSLRDIKVLYAEGEQGEFAAEQLAGIIPMLPGDVYSSKQVRASVDALQQAFGKLGYTDVRVSPREIRAETGRNVDVLFVVTQGRRFRTGLIEVVGNSLTRDDVVRRLVTLSPDRPLDASEARESEQRLRQSRLFGNARVAIQQERDEYPGVRDLLVEVSETNTASFNVGATVGSDGGIAGQISLQQKNFDIFDTPDTLGEFLTGQAFRGGGQTFSIVISPGDRTNNFSIGLSDPALGTSDYSGSIEASYRTRQYRAYDERRLGLNLSLGRKFGSQWQVSAPLRIEQVSLSNIDADAPTDYFDAKDARLFTSVGLTLSRTSLDRAVFPTKGSKIEASVEQFLPPGEDTFTGLRFGAQRYLKLREDVLGRATTLLVKSEARYIPGGEDIAPFYQRLYLGGQNFRGFALRGASPVGVRQDNGQVSGENVGGNWSFFLGAEATQPIYEDKVAGVLFIDTGTVEKDFGFDNYRVSVGFGVRLSIEQISAVPLAFDFGFPIVKEETDRTRFFTFSIDLPFN